MAIEDFARDSGRSVLAPRIELALAKARFGLIAKLRG